MIGSTWFQIAGPIVLFLIMVGIATLISIKKLSKQGFIWAIVCTLLLTWVLFGRSEQASNFLIGMAAGFVLGIGVLFVISLCASAKLRDELGDDDDE